MNKNRLVLPTDFEQGDNLTYQNINDAFESINRFNEAYGSIYVTQQELRTLRDNGQLIPGAQYRIIDYNGDNPLITTAGHMFDIIMTAIDEYTLSNKASAAQHDGDEYFRGCNLSQWEISFELGKGASDNLILYKTDINDYSTAVDYEEYYEYEGEFEYEGNIYYKFVKREKDGDPNIYILTDTLDFSEVSLSTPYTPVAELRYEEGSYVTIEYHTSDLIVSTNSQVYSYISYMKDEFNNECYYDFKNALFKRYYINQVYHENLIDLQGTYLGIKIQENAFYEIDEENFINVYTFGYTEDATLTGQCFNNQIYPASKRYSTNNITFGPASYNNTVFWGSTNNSFGDNCHDNIIGNEFYNNTCGNNIYRNTFGNEIRYNSFGNEICQNTFGNEIRYNSFGNNIYRNTFGNDIWNNSFGNDIWNNSFGNNIYENTFGNNIYRNTFGNYIINNTFGNGVGSNTFGNYIYNNSFGNNILYNTFGNGVGNNTFGNYFQYNTVENHMVYAILADYIWHAKFLSGLSFDSATNITGIFTIVSYCQYVGKNSAGQVIIKNPMD